MLRIMVVRWAVIVAGVGNRNPPGAASKWGCALSESAAGGCGLRSAAAWRSSSSCFGGPCGVLARRTHGYTQVSVRPAASTWQTGWMSPSLS
jgi:hypothetical protein